MNGSGPSGVAGGPADYATLNANAASVTDGKVKISLPARSVVCMVVDKK